MGSLLELEQALLNSSKQISSMLDELLPIANGSAIDNLLNAMRYSTLSDGKRIRPFLTLEISKILDVNPINSMRVASAIEIIHSYSLIHDDLPSIDNDDIRRGKQSCHKAFGEATAILAGDALLTYAFEIITNEKTHPDPAIRCELSQIISKASGYNGIVGGQIMDIYSENKLMTELEIITLQRMKTGALFSASCESACILGKTSEEERLSIMEYSNNIGLAFQIMDDILDICGDPKKTGKSNGKDITAKKATLPSIWGLDKSKNYIEELINNSIENISIFGQKAKLLKDLSIFVGKRDS